MPSVPKDVQQLEAIDFVHGDAMSINANREEGVDVEKYTPQDWFRNRNDDRYSASATDISHEDKLQGSLLVSTEIKTN